MYPVKQSTALDVIFFAHDANGDAVTGKVDGDFTKRISQNGGAFAAMTVTISERENGWYHCQLSTSHTGTLGVLSVTFTASGIKQVNMQFRVHARILDDLCYPVVSGRGIDVDATGGVEITANQNVNVAQWLGSAPNALVTGRVDSSVGAMAADVVTAAAIATDAIGSAELATTAVNEIRDSILSDSTAFAGANIDAAVSTRATPAQVNTEVDTALTDIGLDHLLSASVLGTDIVNDSIIAQLVSSAGVADWDTFDNTTDSLQAVRDNQAAAGPDAATIADAVWDEARAGHVGAGSFGEGVASVQGNVTGSVASVTAGVSLATDAIDSTSVATSGAQEIADELLKRDMSAVTGESARSPLNALRILRNKYSIAAGTLTVTKEDDIATAWTSALTTDAAANPITASDPA